MNRRRFLGTLAAGSIATLVADRMSLAAAPRSDLKEARPAELYQGDSIRRPDGSHLYL